MRIKPRAGLCFALALSTLLATRAVSAGPADYVVPAVIEEGELEIDIKAGSAKLRDALNAGLRESQVSVGLGWGATSWWFTELYAIWHKQPREAFGFDAWEWENRFQFTETGRYPVDVGLLIEIERPRDRSEGYELRWGPLFQAELSPQIQANLNLLLTKTTRGEEGEHTTLGYQWQLKYRWLPELEWGAQGFGSLGRWDRWAPTAEQSHQIGPALFGRLGLGQKQAIKYNAAFLFGLNGGAPRNTVRVQTEIEF